MNGGALVAIPTALAVFGSDPNKAKGYLLAAALSFVAGLVAVLLAQACAFFTMATRSESDMHKAHSQSFRLGAVFGAKEQAEGLLDRFVTEAQASDDKISNSNLWRFAGIAFFWASLVAFIVGCWFGYRAVAG